MNEQLKSLYEAYFLQLKEREFPEKTSAPLFMSVFDKYHTSKQKILIVGQETNGWREMNFIKYSVNSLTKDYQIFSLGQNRNFGGYEGKKKRDYLTSYFWNFSRSFFSKINEVDRGEKGFLWTNISKFDINTTTPNKEYYYLESFELLRKEVKIINPDIVLFMTGDKYSEEIENLLNLKFETIFTVESGKTSIERVNRIKDEDFPKHTYRINHPRYLCSIRSYKTILDKLIELINHSKS